MADKSRKSYKPLSTLLFRVELYEGYIELAKRSNPTKKEKFYKQKLDLITSRVDFQDEVKFFRKRNGIPSNGFESVEECVYWAKEIDRKSNYKKLWDEDPIQAEALFQKGLKEFINALPNTAYDFHLKCFLQFFDIDSRWLEAVEYYLLFNSTGVHSVMPKAVALRMMNDPKRESRLFV